ncbi:hypothetical protein F5Y14DRAFT_450652 [Nemania sp. NC0429]|nr:hypothetical protein F5Y14DRAFT_450652 [Nemania sp. NC0429]
MWTAPLPATPYSENFNSQSLDHGSGWVQETDFLSTTTVEAVSLTADTTVADMQLDQVLSRLLQMEAIGKLVRRWWRVNPSGPVTRSLLDKVLVSVESAADRVSKGHMEAKRLAIEVREASSRPWAIPPSTSSRELPKLLTEPSLRLEAIGIILATAGTAALCLLESDILFSVLSLNAEDRRLFAKDMLSASDTCIAFCDDSSAPHDLMIWLRYTNFLLTLDFCGYADHQTWSRSGQLFGDALAMEMHREPKETSHEMPLFLNEMRTSMFACLYTHDKFLSNILDRLPRIPRLYCSRKLPLGVSDEKLLGTGSTLEEILYGTDSEGWKDEESHPVNLLRARFIFATLREDILNIRLGNPSEDKEPFIRQMPARIAAAWEGLPSRLRFDPNASDLGKPYVYITNVFLYLEYLDLYYCAHQLLCQHTGKIDDSNLLQMALTLITTVVNCVRRYCRRFGASKEVSSTLWMYGLPSAIMLASIMRQRAELGQDMPRPTSWATLYRQLSVLASELEANADPKDGNFPLYSERSRLLSEQLDRALDARHGRRRSDATLISPDSSEISMADIGLMSNMGAEEFADSLTDMAADNERFDT